jgi:hypothetical protein
MDNFTRNYKLLEVAVFSHVPMQCFVLWLQINLEIDG